MFNWAVRQHPRNRARNPNTKPHIAPPEPDFGREMGVDKTRFKVDNVHDLFQTGRRTLLQGRKMHIFFLVLLRAQYEESGYPSL
jgi:hypothetical protein